MDQSSAIQNRKSRRSNVLLAATLEADGKTLSVKLRNLSADGALVDGKPLPTVGCEVVFRRNDLEVPGRVAWVHANHAGIAFIDALQPEEVLRHVPTPRPKYDINFRRPGLKTTLTEEEMRFVESWRR